jgi:hypothetical protein
MGLSEGARLLVQWDCLKARLLARFAEWDCGICGANVNCLKAYLVRMWDCLKARLLVQAGLSEERVCWCEEWDCLKAHLLVHGMGLLRTRLRCK